MQVQRELALSEVDCDHLPNFVGSQDFGNRRVLQSCCINDIREQQGAVHKWRNLDLNWAREVRCNLSDHGLNRLPFLEVAKLTSHLLVKPAIRQVKVLFPSSKLDHLLVMV